MKTWPDPTLAKGSRSHAFQVLFDLEHCTKFTSAMAVRRLTFLAQMRDELNFVAGMIALNP